ncbi:DUF1294 domain-containing protein [Virgibacillus salexigens]|uniref:DUF1294 domain-containing protein n=2 Tax=Virgibacillus TaxID=84406 RepID=A0A024QAX9_9BACI|nr:MULTISPECIES: DUF1294 domain-containing protein [Virgibacillus]MYL41560.1 DUF1294 domain-containing protein [Virgibacillus massiliensis]CDQ39365.1 hypothetical protein BN990_01662 [Virgibacillus massiliensis]
MELLSSLIPYLIGVNVITFLFMGMDKQRAKKQQYRIPERTFWLLAIVGGSLGLWAGMKTFHHKTKHMSFRIGSPILILLHVIIVCYVVFSLS